MGDQNFDLSEEQIAQMFPHIKGEDRAAFAESYSRYLNVVAKVYDRLQDEGKLEEVLLRAQYNKRDRNKPTSHNEDGDE